MKTLLINPLSSVWLILVAATALTAWLTETEHGIRWATIAILLIASLKIGLIMSHFMELKSAPTVWQWAFTIWLVVVTAVVISGFVVI